MAYVTTNPPSRIAGEVGRNGLWLYTSADVHTDVDAADYFSNGAALGMKVNDVVIVTKSTATIGSTLHTVTTVTAGGAATVAAAILA
jgi:lipid-binding SYLF domain-containing protein